MNRQPRCDYCNQFVNTSTAYLYFTPDSEYTIESYEWWCLKCIEELDLVDDGYRSTNVNLVY